MNYLASLPLYFYEFQRIGAKTLNMKTSVLRYGKQTNSLRKVSLSLSRMETEHPPSVSGAFSPCLPQFPVKGSFHQRKQKPSGFMLGQGDSPIEEFAAIFYSQEQKSEESTACEPCQKPPCHFCRKCPEQKEAYQCNHLPEQEMQAPTLPPRLTEASPVYITWVSSNFNNVSNTHIFLEGWQ